MKFLSSICRSKTYNIMVGIMGIIAIPLLVYNLYIAEAVDKIFAFTELVFLMLILGTFVQLVEGKKTRK